MTEYRMFFHEATFESSPSSRAWRTRIESYSDTGWPEEGRPQLVALLGFDHFFRRCAYRFMVAVALELGVLLGAFFTLG